MAKEKSKKAKISKPVALVLVILMMGSTISMLVGIILNPSDEIEVPANRIIKYKMTEPQVKELLRNYHTVLEYEYPSYCLECNDFLAFLEQWTMTSDNQIYLQEIQVESSSSAKLTITSWKGQEILYDPSQDNARNDICELLITRSLFCVEIPDIVVGNESSSADNNSSSVGNESTSTVNESTVNESASGSSP